MGAEQPIEARGGRRRIASMLGVGDDLTDALRELGDGLNWRLEQVSNLLADVRDLSRLQAEQGRVQTTFFVGECLNAGVVRYNLPFRMHLTQIIVSAVGGAANSGTWDIECGGLLYVAGFDATGRPHYAPIERILEAGAELTFIGRAASVGNVFLWLKGWVRE